VTAGVTISAGGDTGKREGGYLGVAGDQPAYQKSAYQSAVARHVNINRRGNDGGIGMARGNMLVTIFREPSKRY